VTVACGSAMTAVNLGGLPPRDQKERFVRLVTRGKSNMPPWGDLLKPEDVAALWACVVAGSTDGRDRTQGVRQ